MILQTIPNYSKYICVSLIPFLISLVECSDKWWVVTSELSDPKNWDGGNAPCPGQTVHFSKSSRLPILIDSELSIGELVLSVGNEFIWAEEGSLLLAGLSNQDHSTDDSCSGPTQFHPPSNGKYWDPDSWRSTDPTEEASTSPDQSTLSQLRQNQAVPDTDRVPCSDDRVLIPDTNLSIYQIIFTRPTPTVARLRLGSKNMTTSSFAQFSATTEGRVRILRERRHRQTYHVDTVDIYIEREGSCTDPSGCPCQAGDALTEICRIKSAKCPKLMCDFPIRVQGFCCDFCGVDIAISPNGSLSLPDIKKLSRRLNSDQEVGVDVYANKMADGFVHVYFAASETGIGGNFVDVAMKFWNTFQKEYNDNNVHQVAKLTATGSHTRDSKSSSALVKFGEVVLALVCIAVISLALYKAVQWYMKRPASDRNPLPLMFQRVRAGSRISLVSRRASLAPPMVTSSYSNREGLRFVNPVFNTSTESLEAPSIPPTPVIDLPESEFPTQRENPLYNIPPVEKGFGMTFSTLKDLQEEDEDTRDEGTIDSDKRNETKSQPKPETDFVPKKTLGEEPSRESELEKINEAEKKDEERKEAEHQGHLIEIDLIEDKGDECHGFESDDEQGDDDLMFGLARSRFQESVSGEMEELPNSVDDDLKDESFA